MGKKHWEDKSKELERRRGQGGMEGRGRGQAMRVPKGFAFRSTPALVKYASQSSISFAMDA